MGELAGSLEPTNAGEGKWWNGLGSQQIKELNALAVDIDKAIDTTIKQVARGKIRVGKLLLEARAHFEGRDVEFGKWRREFTMVQSKQHAHYLMQVAERFGDAPRLIDGANYSVLQELVLADQEDIEWVEAKIEAGEPPTVVEVRKKVKEGKPPTGTSKKGTTITQSPMVHNPNMALNQIVKLGLANRITTVVKQGIKGIEGDLLILGLDPDPQCPCHPEVLDAVLDLWREEATDGDQLRAVNDSYERVRHEFENWERG